MKTFKFSLMLRTHENTDVFITLDDNIYGIHSKRVNILYNFQTAQNILVSFGMQIHIDKTYTLKFSNVRFLYKQPHQGMSIGL